MAVDKLGAVCGESRTHGFEGEVPRVIPGIDSNKSAVRAEPVVGEACAKRIDQLT